VFYIFNGFLIKFILAQMLCFLSYVMINFIFKLTKFVCYNWIWFVTAGKKHQVHQVQLTKKYFVLYNRV